MESYYGGDRGLLERKESLSLQGYMVYRISPVPGPAGAITQVEAAMPNPQYPWWGQILVEDVPLVTDPDPSPSSSGSIIARMYGLDVQVNPNIEAWKIHHTVVFEDDRYKGSTLEVTGLLPLDLSSWSQMAIVGGTGQFTLAQGVLYAKTISNDSETQVVDIRITAYYTPLPLHPN
ncbi:hypothetical protein LUZ61_001468 [Rhynchospora tenuis]|uniref:Dirigent protein n=1 Tax=Rhynchospora tenuis TaxID=198213 RepID=A0AAD5ZH96_9POAL|nr:hypothetical protein LUZ61_001468 [Rhynchospora tenuis]